MRYLCTTCSQFILLDEKVLRGKIHSNENKTDAGALALVFLQENIKKCVLNYTSRCCEPITDTQNPCKVTGIEYQLYVMYTVRKKLA